VAGGRQLAAARLKVVPGDYGVRRITVKKKFMRLTPEQIARWKRETALIKAVYNRFTPRPLWSGGFIRPLDSVVVGAFGRRSIINGQERSPHGGVDLRGKTGTPVKAPAGGRVALVLDTFFGGNTILIDHGLGLVSVYMHLSVVLVKKGQRVHQGQVIGRVGATGRVTGPHLHFGIVLRGLKIDPLAWVELSRRLADSIRPRPGRSG
jgi:murein DD-endopeptidase MepM/ murein hydrolase activator NlpD